MESLNKNWLTEGLIDFEFKKYLLLAYLQDAGKSFDDKKLFPKLSELVEHYQNLQLFRKEKLSVEKDFPKEISRLDFEKFKVEYKEVFKDDEVLKEIDAIVEFALPELENSMGIGRELYEEVENKLEVFPIGIIPLHTEEGYLFLSDFLKKLVNVYYYQITIFENMQEKYRGIHTRHLFNYDITVTQTYEQVKYRLIENNNNMPAPAAYAVEFKQSFPLPETMLPIAKRSLVRYISVSDK
jgi:hypothetical protein